MENQYKQRLVGAAVLVALAVILIPMILDGSGYFSDSGSISGIPPAPEIQDTPLEELAELVPVPMPGEGLPTPIPSADSGKPASTTNAPTAWVVQVGSFSSKTNAEALRSKLKKQKLSAFILEVSDTAGLQYKVRVGPETDQNRAEALRTRLQAELGNPALLLKYP